jgi:O-antigen/teichoic acid export membrane protein
MAVVCTLAPLVIPLLFGESYSAAVPVALALSTVTIGLKLLGNIYWSLDQYQNRGDRCHYGMNVIVTKAVYIVLLVGLLPFLGMAGAVVAILVFDVLQFLFGYRFYRHELALEGSGVGGT